MGIKLNRVGVSLFIISTLGGLTYLLGWSTLVTIQSIEISGTNQRDLVSAKLLTGGSNLLLKQPLARINPRHEENLITDLEWIKSAQVSRNWWSREVKVLITPRIPVAIFTLDGAASAQPRYLASDGRDFASPQNFTNLATISLVGENSDRLKQRRVVANFVANLPAELVAVLKNLEISKNREIIMATDLRKPILRINWGSANSAEEILIKSNILKGLLNLPENRKISFIDLTVATAPITK